MGTYIFTFVIEAENPETEVNSLADALYEAGCDDALLGTTGGEICLDFCREADSERQAVAEAVRQVRAAGAKVVRMEKDQSK